MVFEALLTAGVFPVYLAFLLVFAIIFALLQYTKVLGGTGKIDALIALIVSLYLVALSPLAGAVSLFFVDMFATVGVFLVSLLAFLLIIGLLAWPAWQSVFGKEAKWGKYGLLILAIIIGFLIVSGASFGGVGIPGAPTIPTISQQDLIFLGLVILTLIIVFWMIKGGAGAALRGIIPVETK